MGISADREKAALSFKRRIEASLRKYQDLIDDTEHWNRMNPEEEPIVIKPIDHG